MNKPFEVTAMLIALTTVVGCQTSSLERTPDPRCSMQERQEYEALKSLALKGFLVGGLIGQQVAIQQHQPRYNELKELCK